MSKKPNGFNTRCVHSGELQDTQFKGAVSPLFPSSSYAYEGVEKVRYPRYFNTPNQEALAKKMAALEGGEQALIFGSGMAAVSNALLAFLQAGDHVVLQQSLYGGTYNLAVEEFSKYGIQYSFTHGNSIEAFEAHIKENTKVIYIETPSNPLLTITDIRKISELARRYGLVSMIDNTFASPVNQNPIDLGIDISIHSATKYMGGHSDILAGAVIGSASHIERIFQLGKNLGGNLSDYTVWLLERSMKTMGLRVRVQSENALEIARFLDEQPEVKQVFYPGLPSHPDHAIAATQMRGFGGMLSFELAQELDVDRFLKSLRWIKPSMSLAGVESTILAPAKTSHGLLTPQARREQGISDGLLRLSVGIEEYEDLIEDISQALVQAK